MAKEECHARTHPATRDDELAGQGLRRPGLRWGTAVRRARHSGDATGGRVGAVASTGRGRRGSTRRDGAGDPRRPARPVARREASDDRAEDDRVLRVGCPQVRPPVAGRPEGRFAATDRPRHALQRTARTWPVGPDRADCHTVICQALEQARRWGLIARNPAVDATPPVQRRREIVPPTVEQAESLLDAAEADDADLAAYLWVLAATGCRRGEARALRWSDVDLERTEVLIRRSISQVGREVREKDTKAHQSRRLALDAETVTVLRSLRLRARARVGARRASPTTRCCSATRRVDRGASACVRTASAACGRGWAWSGYGCTTCATSWPPSWAGRGCRSRRSAGGWATVRTRPR